MLFEKKRVRKIVISSVLLFMFTAHAAPLKQLNWVGCGVSKTGFMQDLSAAYEKKQGYISISTALGQPAVSGMSPSANLILAGVADYLL